MAIEVAIYPCAFLFGAVLEPGVELMVTQKRLYLVCLLNERQSQMAFP